MGQRPPRSPRRAALAKQARDCGYDVSVHLPSGFRKGPDHSCPPHLMFYAPYATDEDIRLPPATAEMPHVIRPGQPDAYIIVIPGRGSHAGH